MTTKTWARLSAANTVAELQTFDAALVPGKDVPAIWTDDVTGVAGIAVGWVKSAGTFAAPTSALPSAANLEAYADAKLANVSASGITVNVGTSSAPIAVMADTTADGKANLAGILQGYSLGVLTGPYTWYQTGGSVSLTQAQLQAVSTAVLTFISAAYATWQSVLTGIAGGTVTTDAQIDAAAWPAA